MAARSLPHYWVDVILTTAWECRRFDCEREALAYAQVYARLPNAEAVVAYAYARREEDDLRLERSMTKHGRRAKHGSHAATRQSQ
jgi:hypothetical protein